MNKDKPRDESRALMLQKDNIDHVKGSTSYPSKGIRCHLFSFPSKTYIFFSFPLLKSNIKIFEFDSLRSLNLLDNDKIEFERIF